MNKLSPPPPTMRNYAPIGDDMDTDQRGTIRALAEAFVSLFIAVLLFRSFAAEGYMISTGSMAPCLLGFHKRVVCPSCHITFPFGTAYDTDEDPDNDQLQANRSQAICPNCGQGSIDIADVPRNHGDQLLVNKQAYLYQAPKRWDIIVFRNPAKPTEAYVKRMAGLPGERIQIANGDVIIDGEIARKNYRQQLSTRILVHDHDFRPVGEDDFRSHWQIVGESPDEDSRSKSKTWSAQGNSFMLRGGDVRRPDKTPIEWVEYRHWIRSGGIQDSSVSLAQWPENVPSSSVPKAGLRYEPKTQQFSVTGALSSEVAKQLLELSEDEPFRDAVHELYEASHVVPISDEYGYNPIDEAGTPTPVRDLMFSARIFPQGGTGEFLVELTDGATVFSVVFDVIRREVHLYSESLEAGKSLSESLAGPKSDPVATAPWPAKFGNEGGLIEVSTFDRQVIVAIDGRQILEPFPFQTSPEVPAPKVPVRFGGRGLDIKVNRLKVYRDVYYTDSRSRHGVTRPFELRDNQFFVLGDNSPVSHDSRRWDDPTVHRSHLIGKPFLVHLPSKPATLRLGNRTMPLRMPDWERIRLLR